MKYYYIAVSSTEIEHRGPFDTHEERDKAAKEEYARLNVHDGDNVFWMDIQSDGVPNVGSFIAFD